MELNVIAGQLFLKEKEIYWIQLQFVFYPTRIQEQGEASQAI